MTPITGHRTPDTGQCRPIRVAHAALAAAWISCAMLTAAPAAGQTPAGQTDVYMRAKSSGQPTPGPLALSLKDAVTRGLDNNLGVLLQEARVGSAEGARWKALSDVLPHVTANVRQSEQIVNLAAFGFSGFPGIPQVIGPFGVFDARVAVSTPLFDLSALRSARSASESVSAEKFSAKNAREIVVLAVANLYFEALADAGRVDAAKAQVATAETLVTLTHDQQVSGVVAGIEVLRQQVELQSARQRQIAAENQLAKRKLDLGRAIGLPPGQVIDLTDKLPETAPPPPDQKDAVSLALSTREDLKSAEALASAARLAKESASAERLPSVHLDGDAGAAGSSVTTTTGVFTIAATLKVPIFEGGSTKGRLAQTDADLRQREAELADLKTGVEYEVASALLDVTSETADMEAARSGQDLARQQLTQAQDRFRAGVTSTLELAQAQDALAAATDQYISSLYRNLIARAMLARAMGVVEARFTDFVGGSR